MNRHSKGTDSDSDRSSAYLPQKERTVIQIDLLLIYLNIHLHHNLFKVFPVVLSQVLYVMVASNKIDFSVQPAQYVYPFSRTAQTKVT